MAVAVALSASPSGAQPDDGWIVQQSAELVSASIEYSSGLAVVAQCRSGQLAMAILNMPPDAHGSTGYQVERPGRRAITTFWERQEDGTTLLARSNPRLIRFLREGGTLSLRGTGGPQRNLRLDLDLPPDPAGLDAVLRACRYPLANDRDELEGAENEISEAPTLEMPARILSRSRPVFQVEISCVIENGRYSSCRSERETPSDPQDGATVARQLNGVRVRAADPLALEGRVLNVTVTGNQVRRRR